MRTSLQRLVSLGLVSAWLTATTVLIIWATFGFRYPASPGMPPDSTAHFVKPPRVFETAPPLTDRKTQTLIDQYGRTDISVWQQLVHPSPRIGRCILWARDHRLLPEAYLYGLAFTVRSTASRWSFLLGKAKETGWWYYFPVALAVKTPLATIGVVIMALFLAARRSFRPSRDPFVNVSAASMALFIGLYLFTAMTGNINLGLRHLIPVQMLLFVLCGAAASLVSPDRHWTRPTLHALIACLAGASLAAWPNYLPFFNSFVGGPKNGWKYLADSNVDWGQDLPALARYLREHNEKDVKLAYFGVGRPEYYGIQASYFPVPYEACVLDGGPPGPIARFTPGTYALSATALQGWNLPYEYRPWTKSLDTLERRLAGRFQHLADNGPIPTDPATKRHFDLWRQLQYARLLHALRQRRPHDQVGHSILIYRLDPQDLNEIFPPPMRPPPNDPPQSRIPPTSRSFRSNPLVPSNTMVYRGAPWVEKRPPTI